jgi:hypothetical protein
MESTHGRQDTSGSADSFPSIPQNFSTSINSTSHFSPNAHADLPALIILRAGTNAIALFTLTMPPRLRSSNLSNPAASTHFTSCWAAPSQAVSCMVRPSRHFSQTPHPQITLRRRKFYEWLNGPGRQLREPIPGSTNYLGAYDKHGNLVRAGPGWRKNAGAKAAAATGQQQADIEAKAKAPPEDATPASQESLDKLEAAIRSGEVEEKEAKTKGEAEDDGKLPPETAEDLRPFPLNQYFRSQPVLSEALREAIYQRVKKDGATVSLASVEFGVSNERVGAVVRLKQTEKEWIAQVCTHLFRHTSSPQ